MFEGFQNFIPKITNKLHLTEAVTGSHVCTVARKVLAADYPELGKNCEVISFKDQKLRIGVYSSTIANEFFYKRTEILAKINSELSSTKVLDLFILTSNKKSLD